MLIISVKVNDLFLNTSWFTDTHSSYWLYCFCKDIFVVIWLHNYKIVEQLWTVLKLSTEFFNKLYFRVQPSLRPTDEACEINNEWFFDQLWDSKVSRTAIHSQYAHLKSSEMVAGRHEYLPRQLPYSQLKKGQQNQDKPRYVAKRIMKRRDRMVMMNNMK